MLMDNRVLSFGSIIQKYSKEFKVPENIICKVIIQESGGNTKAWNPQSNENSRGLMQMSEVTASGYGFNSSTFNSLYNPDTNIKYGTRLLSDNRNSLSRHFDKNISEIDKWKIIVSSYNQGTAYYIKALKKFKALNKPQSWPLVVSQMKADGLPRFTLEAIDHYGPSVMTGITEVDTTVNGRFTTNSTALIDIAVQSLEENPWLYALPAISMLGLAIYVAINHKKRNDKNGITNRSNTSFEFASS